MKGKVTIYDVNKLKVQCPYCNLVQFAHDCKKNGNMHYCFLDEGGCGNRFIVEIETGVSNFANGQNGFEHVIYSIVKKIQGEGLRTLPWDAPTADLFVVSSGANVGCWRVIFQASSHGFEQVKELCGIVPEEFVHGQYNYDFDDEESMKLFIKWLESYDDFDHYKGGE